MEKRNGRGRMNEIKHGKYYTCKRLRMLEYLKKRGFEPRATIPDPTNIKYNWWLFDNTPEFERCVYEYFEQMKPAKIN
jgi:hypothetical protein